MRQTSTGWQTLCPAHDDRNPSLSITQGEDGRTLVKCQAGCTTEGVVSAVGIQMRDLFIDSPKTNSVALRTCHAPKRIVATYPYLDAEGKLAFEVVRYDPKGFRQRRPDGKGGWFWNMEGVNKVLFRLPQVMRDVRRGLPIWQVEGEADAVSMEEHGFTGATCNPGGAGKWQDSYSETLRNADVIVIADKDKAGREHAQLVASKLQGFAKRVRVIELPDVGEHTVKDARDFFRAGGDAGTILELADAASDWKPAEGFTGKLLSERQFNPAITPPPLRPVYTLAGTVVATPANLATITAASKAGKSVVIEAMLASAMATANSADCLSFKSSNPQSFALLHFDSEQSPDDHWHGISRALKRAGRTAPPKFLHSYCLTGLEGKQAWQCISEAIRVAAEVHGGIHSILIDGVADFVANVNDPAECNAFVATLHGIAIERDCSIIGVIHFNPGGEKTRGHLGSQLERKAETNLRLDKENGVTVVWSDKQRRAPIPRESGPCFAWNDEAGMHVSVERERFGFFFARPT